MRVLSFFPFIFPSRHQQREKPSLSLSGTFSYSSLSLLSLGFAPRVELGGEEGLFSGEAWLLCLSGGRS